MFQHKHSDDVFMKFMVCVRFCLWGSDISIRKLVFASSVIAASKSDASLLFFFFGKFLNRFCKFISNTLQPSRNCTELLNTHFSNRVYTLNC